MDPEFYGVIGACAAIVILILKIFAGNGCFITSPCGGKHLCVLDTNEGNRVAELVAERTTVDYAERDVEASSQAVVTAPAAVDVRLFGSPYVVLIRDPAKTERVLQRIQAAQAALR